MEKYCFFFYYLSENSTKNLIMFLQVVSGPIKLVPSLVFIKHPIKLIMLSVINSQLIFSLKCVLIFLENSKSIGYYFILIVLQYYNIYSSLRIHDTIHFRKQIFPFSK